MERTCGMRAATLAGFAWMLTFTFVGCDLFSNKPGNNQVLENIPPQNGENEKEKDKNPTEPEVDPKQTAKTDPKVPEIDPKHPFQRQFDIPDFPVGREWMNSRPLSKADLKGKFVIYDFWTYCCINCMHILPELKKLEKEFPNELVVIGVHSAKFDTEKDRQNILDAILRYEIEHPVVNDADHEIWDSIGINSWPTILLVDPHGKAVWGRSGEFKAPEVAEILKTAIPYYQERGELKQEPFPLELERDKQPPTALLFPGKIVADEKGERLFIADSNHNRILITDLAGKITGTIGSGKMGKDDGNWETATFDHPQGMAVTADGKTLYVADTENHLLRKVDLTEKKVTTIAGVGSQARSPWPGLEGITAIGDLPERFVGPPLKTAINSPWDLWIHGDSLYIAMAGPHQIWKMPLDEAEIGPYAGNGREDIVDGPLLPQEPWALGASSFAQPSGLSSDGTSLFVADSEGSSIRAVPLDGKSEVTTVLGTAGLPGGRLFTFGDIDGEREEARLQHALGVTYVDGKLYIADTYNNKIKVIDAKTGATKTIAGDGKPGKGDDPPQFDEPAGISHAKGMLYIADTNNHLIRTLELASGKVGTLKITDGKESAATETNPAGSIARTSGTAALDAKPDFSRAKIEKLPLAVVKPTDGKVTLHVQLKLPLGWKINPLAPMSYFLDSPRETGAANRSAFGKVKLPAPTTEFDVVIPVANSGEDTVAVAFKYYYCEAGKDEGDCKFGSVVFEVPIQIAADGSSAAVNLTHQVP